MGMNKRLVAVSCIAKEYRFRLPEDAVAGHVNRLGLVMPDKIKAVATGNTGDSVKLHLINLGHNGF